MGKITYTNKVALNENSSIADINKVKADDMNEIKNIVNGNDDIVGSLSDLTTPTTSSIVDAINSVVESGSNSNGNYIKYADGTMICTKSITGTATITSSWGSLYYTGNNPISLGDFAQTFISTPKVSLQFTGGNSQWIAGFNTSPTTSSAGSINIVSATNKTANIYYDLIAIGKWK